MKELIQQLVTKAHLDETQATQAVDVVRTFLGEKLPGAIREPALRAISGEHVEGAMGAAKGVAGKMFG
jgi:hypothetical protein